MQPHTRHANQSMHEQDRLIAEFMGHVPDSRIAAYSESELNGIFQLPEGKAIPAAWRDSALEQIKSHYTRASSLAAINQMNYQRTGTYAYYIATASVAFMAIAVVFGGHFPIVATICYVCELSALIFLYKMIHKSHENLVHSKWLGARALAERLRSTFFFLACGMHPGKCTGDEEDGDDWVSRVISDIRNQAVILPTSDPPPASVLDRFIRAAWLRDQIAYHERKSSNCTAINSRLKSWALRLFGAAIGISGLHLLVSLLGFAGHHPHGVMLKVEELLTVVAVTLPAAAAAVGGYRILLEYSRIADRSYAMSARLKRLDAAIPEAGSQEELQRLLIRCEDVMLSESRDWFSLMSHADLERIA